MKKKILITSALPYANGPLHFGHIAGAYLPGDCYARFQRMQGNDVLYICGSDEYGIAITLSAELAGRSPKEHVDHFHEVNKNFFKTLNFSFDHFSRTTTKFHENPVHQFFNDLLNNGFIEERMTEQLYSEQDGRFLADRYVTGTCPSCGYPEARGDECQKCGSSFDATDLKNPRSKMTGAPLKLKETKHWFLLLEKFQDRLNEWIEKKNWKPNVVNFIKGYIKNLKARAITRDIRWGVPVPLEGAEGKVLYVWFDAPIGYISATQEWAEGKGNSDLWKDYWCDPATKLVQFIGKDNIPFHAAIFPAMVMGQNEPYVLVDELPANEFYNLEGKQFSKSDGWYIDLEEFFKKYSADQIRYAIAANAPETQDSEFTWKDFQQRCNAELLGKLGNFVNRVLVFAKNNTASAVPERGELTSVDAEFIKEVCKTVEEIKEAYEGFKLRRASQLIMELAQKGNVYFDFKKPWTAAKDPSLTPSMKTTINLCLETLKLLALVSCPIMPATATRIWNMLKLQGKVEEALWDDVVKNQFATGHLLSEPEILFRKVEDAEIEAEIAKLKEMSSKAAPKKIEAVKEAIVKGEISFDQFQQIDLKVGLIKHAEKLPKSKKLLKLLVDLGSDERTIVSGIAEVATPESLVGKKVVVVANLAPQKIMGVESQGMILCGSKESGLEILTLIDCLPGASIR
ncbi:methionine--tRNA ligase [Estrella lausannensis]|uniref:Methionine--tRNA ligase n=1 Tax=Estrella lausannensis TaxID=483423 RepID=A0A0H5DU99_9BACT|nr:methionine--tRNA ligase [Estrella lausannensis]CRX39499.1 Methionine--tRNA ligase [Estrella lausannensis]